MEWWKSEEEWWRYEEQQWRSEGTILEGTILEEPNKEEDDIQTNKVRESSEDGNNIEANANDFCDFSTAMVCHFNCGFRAIAAYHGLDEDSWPTIRSNLMEELEMNKESYIQMFGEGHWLGLHNSMDFFDTNQNAPYEKWITNDMGIIIASRYNVILHILSIKGSLTYLPLRSSPPRWYEHVYIAIGLVGNHFVKVTLAEGYPMPTITPEWNYLKDNRAAEWATPYQSRINTYTLDLQANCTRDYVNLD